MGGGGGRKSKPSPQPQLQTFDPAALAQAQAQASATQMRMLPETAEKLAGVNREQGALDLRQYVQLLQDPGSVIYADELKSEQKKIDDYKKALSGPSHQGWTTKVVRNPFDTGPAWIGVGAVEKALAQSEKRVKELKSFDPQTAYDKAFPEIKAEQQRLIGQLQGTLGPSDEYRRLQSALGQQFTGDRMSRGGLQARTAADVERVADVRAAQMGRVDDVASRDITASRMGDFGRAASRDISAGQVGAGALGQSLMGRAMQMAQSDGRLSAQAERDAVQAARQGMAARGMATGSAALGAELLNRDRYARQRQFEDLAFAQGVQGQDLGRQFQNVGNQLTAAQANQGAAMQAELANLQARYNAAVQQGNWQQAAAIQNQSANLQSQMANQQAALTTGQFNAANRQQAALANQQTAFNTAQLRQQNRQFNAQQLSANDAYNQEAARSALTYNNALGMNLQQANLANRFQQASLADSEQMRQLATREAIIGQRYASDPMLMLLGAPQPNSQIAGLAAQTTGNAMNMGAQAYSFALNQNNSLYNSYQNNQAAMQAARMQAGATSQAGTMGMIGSGVGAAIGIAGIGIAI